MLLHTFNCIRFKVRHVAWGEGVPPFGTEKIYIKFAYKKLITCKMELALYSTFQNHVKNEVK